PSPPNSPPRSPRSRPVNPRATRWTRWRRICPTCSAARPTSPARTTTKTAAQTPVTPEDFSGSYMHWGVREHGMAAAMNGIALHGGLIPYSGAFLVFSDYLRPALRLAALMEERVIHALT